MFSYGGSRSLPPVNKQTENVKLSFNGSYANRESGMEQAQRIPRPLTNRSPTKWVRFVDEDWGRGYGALTAPTQTVKAEWSKPGASPVPLQIEAQRSGFDLWTKTGGADMEL